MAKFPVRPNLKTAIIDLTIGNNQSVQQFKRNSFV